MQLSLQVSRLTRDGFCEVAFIGKQISEMFL